MIVIGPRRDDQVGLPLADLARDRPAVFQGWQQLAIVDIKDVRFDSQDLGAALHLGGPAAGKQCTRHLVMSNIPVGYTHELDLASGLGPACRGSTRRELAVIGMSPEDNHPQRFL